MKKPYVFAAIFIVLGLISFYLLFFGVSKCGGPEELECPNFFACSFPKFRGPTIAAESGRCVLAPFAKE